MGFSEDLARHAQQIVIRTPHIKSEEATKHALVVPLLQLLGYDIFDPQEVQPEYVADFATKTARGQLEKIDYAIWKDGKAAIFVECKATTAALADHDGQLARYFNSTPSLRVGILTNGIRLKAFTDLTNPNIMDSTPFLDVDLTLPLKPIEVEALRRFTKADFSSEQIVALAEELVLYGAIVAFIGVQLKEPSDSFVRFVIGENERLGQKTAKQVERLRPILKKAIQAVIIEQVTRSFEPSPSEAPAPPPVAPAPAPQASMVPSPRSSVPSAPGEKAGAGEIITTEDELTCWRWVEAAIKEKHPTAALAYRDSQSYFTIHQANLRKWFLRLNVQKAPFWVSFRHVTPLGIRSNPPGLTATDGGGLGDSRVALSKFEDLYSLKDAILAAFEREQARKVEEGPPSVA